MFWKRKDSDSKAARPMTDTQPWILSCKKCKKNFIIGVNASVATWEEMINLGKSISPEDIIGKLGTPRMSDLVGDTGAYKPPPSSLSESQKATHEVFTQPIRNALLNGQARRWKCNVCKYDSNNYPALPGWHASGYIIGYEAFSCNYSKYVISFIYPKEWENNSVRHSF